MRHLVAIPLCLALSLAAAAPAMAASPIGGDGLRTLFCCAHTSVYTLRTKIPGQPHPWYRVR